MPTPNTRLDDNSSSQHGQNDFDGSTRLDEIAKAIHNCATAGGGLTLRSRALDHACAIGSFLCEAHRICVPDEKGVQPPESWTSWLKKYGMNRQRANEYMLISEHWDKVSHLQGKGRTQTAALNIIRKHLNQKSPKPRTKTIEVKHAQLPGG